MKPAVVFLPLYLRGRRASLVPVPRAATLLFIPQVLLQNRRALSVTRIPESEWQLRTSAARM
jgi:hypothetical protein